MVLNVHAQGEGAVNVAFLFLVGGLLVARELTVGAVRGVQQGHRLAIRSDLQSGGNGDDGHILLLRQRGGNVAVRQIRQQHIGSLEGIVLPVALADDALSGSNAVVRENAVEVGQLPVCHRPCQSQQLAAGLHVLGKHVGLFRGEIRSRGIDHQRRRILGDLVHGQQRQRFRLNVLLLQLICEGLRQVSLAVSLQGVHNGQLGADHIVNGRGNGSLAVEGGGVGIGISTALGHIDVRIGHVAVLLPGDHDEGIVAHGLIGVLLGKGRVHIRVFLHHIDVVGQAVIFGKQIVDDIVLLAGLDHPIDGHVLLQCIHHSLGVAGDGIELGGADIQLGKTCRQGICQ